MNDKILTISRVVQVCLLRKFLDLYNTAYREILQNRAKSSAWLNARSIWFIGYRRRNNRQRSLGSDSSISGSQKPDFLLDFRVSPLVP
jgi:hypothetical protein